MVKLSQRMSLKLSIWSNLMSQLLVIVIALLLYCWLFVYDSCLIRQEKWCLTTTKQ